MKEISENRCAKRLLTLSPLWTDGLLSDDSCPFRSIVTSKRAKCMREVIMQVQLQKATINQPCGRRREQWWCMMMFLCVHVWKGVNLRRRIQSKVTCNFRPWKWDFRIFVSVECPRVMYGVLFPSLSLLSPCSPFYPNKKSISWLLPFHFITCVPKRFIFLTHTFFPILDHQRPCPWNL